MADVQTRPFSKNYSGLINQSVIAITITVLCVSGQELMKRKRRSAGKARGGNGEGVGSRESWEFGYLYQGRCWAKNPSPPSPQQWPLAWVKQAVMFSEDKLNELRGIDAALYIRFLRGCFWFTLLQTCTTMPILFPIHVRFADSSVSPKSMTRASISSLVETSKGLSLLWIHICLLFWVTFSWMATLLWICNGAFRLRAQKIQATKDRMTAAAANGESHMPEKGIEPVVYYPHPHPQYGFQDVPPVLDPLNPNPNEGLRLRTIMVSNVPNLLRSEKELKEYFEYYMSRKLDKPAVGLAGSTQPGFINKTLMFLFNHAKKLPSHLPTNPLNVLTVSHTEGAPSSTDGKDAGVLASNPSVPADVPIIDRVVMCRKMTELASLLERREETLRLLETAHIRLAKKALHAVYDAMERKEANLPLAHSSSKAAIAIAKRRAAVDLEHGKIDEAIHVDEEERMEQLIHVLGPFVEEFSLKPSRVERSRKALSLTSKYAFRKLGLQGSQDCEDDDDGGTSTAACNPSFQAYPPPSSSSSVDCSNRLGKTVWEALNDLPRSSLDAYQPLVNLSHLFRGKTVPAIDYYTAKLNLLTALITENRAKAVQEYEPVSTAFVTFADPMDAKRACKYLAVHPNNPLACMVTMAPPYEDLDWIRIMKSSFNVEFVKDWVVNLGVWGFTMFWLFPVSLLVGLVSIQNISIFLPGLKSYLDKHPWEEELIQSFLPTLLVALLALLIPLILLLIAKKAHTITTLSALHDRILTRYYKFLIVNVLVFFCVGTAALQSFLNSFKSTTHPNVLKVVADSFPTAGPFYVGWLIFTVAMHGGFEIALFGLPLIMYPSTSRQITPRKRAVGVRPRTFNYYYWLPTHLLVIHVLLLFSLLNPVVIPFGLFYFFIEAGIVKNQLIHVYAKNYEGNGQLILIRLLRYSLDGLILSQSVFLAYMAVLKKNVNVGLAAVLIVFTTCVKLFMTRMCRAQFDHDDITEAQIICGRGRAEYGPDPDPSTADGEADPNALTETPPARAHPSIFTWRLPAWVNFSYTTVRIRPQHVVRRPPNPFGPHGERASFSRLRSLSVDLNRLPMPSQPSSSQEIEADHSEEHEANAMARPTIAPIQRTYSDFRIVVPHPPPVPWDDQTTYELPYDNPFYTRSINNVLWLPRNPCGTLDLDDTVDLRTSLTVELSASELGTWLGAPETSSPLGMSVASNLPTTHSDHMLEVPDLTYTGTEEIELPPVIAKRVQSIYREDDVDQVVRPRRPSAYSRKASGAASDKQSLAGTVRRWPSAVDSHHPAFSFRSFSRPSTRARSSSVLSALEPHPKHDPPPKHDRSRPSEHELGVRPDAHAQADFLEVHGSSSQISIQPPLTIRSGNVSALQAIVREVIAEERHALANRLEDEQAEADKANVTKSWLTSWAFKKSQ